MLESLSAAPDEVKPPRRHRFAAAIVGLLLGASRRLRRARGARMVYSHTVHYWFLMWNLALAWVPFVFAGVAYTLASARRAVLYVLIVAAALVWLVFFPNAPYILTDFLHLGSMGDIVPGWYDVLMLFWFAWTGLMLGVVSLYLMQDIVTRAFGGARRLDVRRSPPRGWAASASTSAASCAGTAGTCCAGRCRWRGSSTASVTDPASQPRLLGFTLLFALLFLFIYVAVYIFAKLTKPGMDAGDR